MSTNRLLLPTTPNEMPMTPVQASTTPVTTGDLAPELVPPMTPPQVSPEDVPTFQDPASGDFCGNHALRLGRALQALHGLQEAPEMAALADVVLPASEDGVPVGRSNFSGSWSGLLGTAQGEQARVASSEGAMADEQLYRAWSLSSERTGPYPWQIAKNIG